MIDDSHSHLLQIYQQALKVVDGRTCVSRFLAGYPKVSTSLVAVGKAAQSMALGACDVLGEAVVDGLVISRAGHLDHVRLEQAGLRTIEGGHPLPDASSLKAGEVLLDFLGQQPNDRALLFLLSGGTSSLVEVLREGVGLEDLQAVNQWLLGSGLPIHQINLVRKGLSAIKGGGLIAHIDPRPTEVLLISDVMGDDPAIIGSGLLMPDPQLHQKLSALPLPAWLADRLNSLSPHIPQITRQVPHTVVANIEMACSAAESAARQLGYQVFSHPEFLSGDAEQRGHELGRAMIEGEPGVHIWGGETTVRLPPMPGRGGRNQHLALAVAMEIAGHDEICLLAAGTDGTDGSTEDAGALVDGGTLARAADEGLDASEYLRKADSGTFFAITGDLVNTGPTDTNVMDLVVGIKKDKIQ